MNKRISKTNHYKRDLISKLIGKSFDDAENYYKSPILNKIPAYFSIKAIN